MKNDKEKPLKKRNPTESQMVRNSGLQGTMKQINATTKIGYAPQPSTKNVKYKGPKTVNKSVTRAKKK